METVFPFLFLVLFLLHDFVWRNLFDIVHLLSAKILDGFSYDLSFIVKQLTRKILRTMVDNLAHN